MIELLKIIHCMDYKKFLELMVQEESKHQQDMFWEMRADLFRFLCSLDQELQQKFIDFAMQKAGKEALK